MTPNGRIWSATSGPAEPPGRGRIVLVHGAMDRSAGMLKLSRRLDHEWTVTRYDRRGYGRSSAVPPPYTVAAQVDDLRAVIDTVAAPGPVVVVGHSFGGNVALALADRHPGTVQAVVVYETPLLWADWWSGTSARTKAEGPWDDDPEAAAEQFMRRLVGDRRWEALPEATRRQRRAEGRALVGELDDATAHEPWRAERIGVPVLTLFGERGRPHHRRAMELVAGSVPDGRVRMVPGAHHFGVNTHADVTAELIGEFLDECFPRVSAPAG